METLDVEILIKIFNSFSWENAIFALSLIQSSHLVLVNQLLCT